MAASTGRIPRTSATGPGPAERGHGPDLGRQRRLDQPEAARGDGGRREHCRRVVRGCGGKDRRGRASSRPRWRAFSGPGSDRRGSASEDPGADRARASAQRSCPEGDRQRTARAARCSACGGVRHLLPPHHPRRGFRVRGAALVARGLGNPPVRVPGAFGAMVRGACPRAARPRGRPSRRLPSRRRVLGHRRRRRALRRHDDGLHAARRRSDEHPLGVGRSGCVALCPA